MPQCVRYTARRSLAPGHVAGGLYTMNLYVTQKDRGRRVQREQSTSLSGLTYTTYYNGRQTYAIETRPMTLTETREMREFLDSAEDGQIILFSPTAWAGASPEGFISCMLDNNTYQEVRSVQRGDDQTNDRFTFRFSLIETL